MPTETEIATQSQEGVSGLTPGSQETGLSSQGDIQLQEGGSTLVGSGTEAASTSQEDARPKASDFVRERKKFQRLESRLAGLEQTNAQLLEVLQNLQTGGASAPSDSHVSQVDLDKQYWENPTKVVQDIINKTIDGKVSTTFDSRFKQERFKREQEEAVKLVISNEQVKKDPEGLERIKEILIENGLDEFSVNVSPIKAAKLALALYAGEKKNSGSSANSIKAQLSASAGGGGSISSGKTLTKEQLKSEAQKLQMQYSENPEIRNDPKFQEKLKYITLLSQK